MCDGMVLPVLCMCDGMVCGHVMMYVAHGVVCMMVWWAHYSVVCDGVVCGV